MASGEWVEDMSLGLLGKDALIAANALMEIRRFYHETVLDY